MSLVEWTTDIETGIDEIDRQHRRFTEMLNEFHDKLEECTSLDEERALTGKAVGELAQYAARHFEYEEKMLSDCHYQGLSLQQECHGFFRDKLDEIIGRHRAGERLLTLDIIHFMRRWWLDHITTSDRQYVAVVKDCAAGQPGNCGGGEGNR
ncbi:MAG: bacteriohemerythrin [Negativicutes bacterium]|nr:bacteriohemerythrin [Negativicutes bacterium]